MRRPYRNQTCAIRRRKTTIATMLGLQLAKRFDEKSFMPTFGDIAHFCRVYDVDEPASKSRAAAVSRVFCTIAAMSAEDIQILVDYGAFSGPARLGPISEAITRRSRTQAQVPTAGGFADADGDAATPARVGRGG